MLVYYNICSLKLFNLVYLIITKLYIVIELINLIIFNDLLIMYLIIYTYLRNYTKS